MIKFDVLGEPQGKGRPKFAKIGNHVSARTPDKTVQYENLIKTEYRRQCGDQRFADKDALCMIVHAYYAIPASASKKTKALMQSGAIRPTKKPDADNILKVVADGLNDIAYRDDAQLVSARVEKFYNAHPKIVVEILPDDWRPIP